MTLPDEDRRCINRWRGLTEAQLNELSKLDQLGLQYGSAAQFSIERENNIRDRARCISLRKEHGLGPMEKAR